VSPTADSSESHAVKALAHPVRVRALAILVEREASPSELADELGEPLGNVSYHVRLLHDLGLIELVSTTPRRGAIEHHYRARSDRHLRVADLTLDDAGWDELGAELRALDERAAAIEARAIARLGGSKRRGRRASLVVALSPGAASTRQDR
jgi:DNA-binding transcriptional ArsR family regulator